ncbi:MAG: DUF4349 domain-containing protein [Defluviitaleaceae bacterium]|nr:DUF4349 domain-containing protein [Defluviitaleaceae bacterium]MCL2836018.1 DUF4349 domain-containing protein [Defluviitaleaceae bacterium]
MGCRQYKEMITLYVDGYLDDVRKARLLAHANTCGRCSGALRAYTDMAGDLRRLAEVVPDTQFLRESMARIESFSGKSRIGRMLPERRARLQGFIGTLGAAAAMFVFVVAASALGLLRPEANQVRHDAGWADYGARAFDMAYAETDSFNTAFFGAQSYGGVMGIGADNIIYDRSDDTYLLYDSPDNTYEAARAGGRGDFPVVYADGLMPAAAPFEEPYRQSAEFEIFGYHPPPMGDILTEQRHLTIETSNAEGMLQSVQMLGIQITDSSTRTGGDRVYSSATIRLHIQQYPMVAAVLTDFGDITWESASVWSLADEINDAQASLSARRSEYERLLTYNDHAGELHGLIILHDRINNVLRQIDSFEGRLRRLYSDANMSTVYISASSPAAAPVALSFAERLLNGFMDGLEGMSQAAERVIVFVTGAIIPAAIVVILISAVYAVIFRRKGNR